MGIWMVLWLLIRMLLRGDVASLGASGVSDRVDVGEQRSASRYVVQDHHVFALIRRADLGFDVSIVGEFTIPAESFALAKTLASAPSMTVEADRLASHSTVEVLPFLWASRGDFEAFEAGLVDDPTVEEATVAERTDEEVLYRIEWSEAVRTVVDEIVDHHGTIAEATARKGTWDLRLRFAEDEMVSTFQDHFQNTDRHFDVERLYHPTEPRQRIFGLTTEQHEALVAAVEEGYFAIPREASAEEIGDRLGISANAASQRIRRGSEALVRSGLTIDDVEEAHPRGST